MEIRGISLKKASQLGMERKEGKANQTAATQGK